MKGGQISSFFAKKGVGKAKPVEEAAIAAAAAIHTTSLFSDLPGEYFGSQGWDEGVLEGESPLAASQRQGESTGLETALRSQLAVAVGELADDEGEDDEVMRKRIESEEARKKLEDAKVNTAKAALRRAQEVGGGGGGPPSTPPAPPRPPTGGGGGAAPFLPPLPPPPPPRAGAPLQRPWPPSGHWPPLQRLQGGAAARRSTWPCRA